MSYTCVINSPEHRASIVSCIYEIVFQANILDTHSWTLTRSPFSLFSFLYQHFYRIRYWCKLLIGNFNESFNIEAMATRRESPRKNDILYSWWVIAQWKHVLWVHQSNVATNSSNLLTIQLAIKYGYRKLNTSNIVPHNC